MSILSDAVLKNKKKIYKDSGKLTKKDLLDLLDENYVGKYVGKKKVEKLDEKYKALYRDFARSLEKDGIKVDGADIKSTKEDKEKEVKTINSSFSPANMTPEGTNPTKELTGSDMGRISKYNYDELKKFPKPFSDNNLTITQLPDGYHFDFHPDGWDFDTEDIAEGCCVMAGSRYKYNDKIRQLPKIDGASIDVEKSIYWLTGGNSMWRFGDMIEGFSGNWNDAKAELVKEMGSEVMEQFNDAKTLGNLMDSFANDDYVQVMYETLGDNHPEWFDYGDEDSESEPVESSDKSIGDDFEDDYSNLDFDTDHPYEDEFEREDRDNKFFNKYSGGHGMRESKTIKLSDMESIISSDFNTKKDKINKK